MIRMVILFPTATGISSNMALQGNGFFVVQGSNNQLSYTRAGNFTTNNAGQLVTPNGQLVMGFPAVNGVVSTNGALGPISVSQSSMSRLSRVAGRASAGHRSAVVVPVR